MMRGWTCGLALYTEICTKSMTQCGWLSFPFFDLWHHAYWWIEVNCWWQTLHLPYLSHALSKTMLLNEFMDVEYCPLIPVSALLMIWKIILECHVLFREPFYRNYRKISRSAGSIWSYHRTKEIPGRESCWRGKPSHHSNIYFRAFRFRFLQRKLSARLRRQRPMSYAP